jgi:hypothetical protein
MCFCLCFDWSNQTREGVIIIAISHKSQFSLLQNSDFLCFRFCPKNISIYSRAEEKLVGSQECMESICTILTSRLDSSHFSSVSNRIYIRLLETIRIDTSSRISGQYCRIYRSERSCERYTQSRTGFTIVKPESSLYCTTPTWECIDA